MREIYQAQRRRVFLLHPFRGGGDPLGRSNPRRRSPERLERKRAEVVFQLVAHRHRLCVDIEYLAPVRRIERPRGDGEIRSGMHVVPPKQLGAGKAGDFTPQFIP